MPAKQPKSLQRDVVRVRALIQECSDLLDELDRALASAEQVAASIVPALRVA